MKTGHFDSFWKLKRIENETKLISNLKLVKIGWSYLKYN